MALHPGLGIVQVGAALAGAAHRREPYLGHSAVRDLPPAHVEVVATNLDDPCVIGVCCRCPPDLDLLVLRRYPSRSRPG